MSQGRGGQEWRTRAVLYAYCETCGAVWESANAHGVAVRHARAHGHRVAVEKSVTYVYDYAGGG